MSCSWFYFFLRLGESINLLIFMAHFLEGVECVRGFAFLGAPVTVGQLMCFCSGFYIHPLVIAGTLLNPAGMKFCKWMSFKMFSITWWPSSYSRKIWDSRIWAEINRTRCGLFQGHKPGKLSYTHINTGLEFQFCISTKAVKRDKEMRCVLDLNQNIAFLLLPRSSGSPTASILILEKSEQPQIVNICFGACWTDQTSTGKNIPPQLFFFFWERGKACYLLPASSDTCIVLCVRYRGIRITGMVWLVTKNGP